MALAYPIAHSVGIPKDSRNRLRAGIDHTLLEALIVERASFNDAHVQYRLFQESEAA
jgi:hypothetical protein